MKPSRGGKPVLFIDIVEGSDKDGNSTCLFELTNDARELLSSIGSRNVENNPNYNLN